MDKLDLDEIPIGARVKTPTGRTGTVIRHTGPGSKLDHFVRIVIQLDDGLRDACRVTLQPHLVRRINEP